jgi:hypothetical protein
MPEPARSLRLRADEVLRRLAADEPIRFLDVRGQKALAATPLHIPGSARVHPVLLPVHPEWEPRQLIVVYCT